MLALKFLFTLVVAIVVVFFLVINGHSVDINYYDYDFEMKSISLPFSMLLVFSTLLGFIAAWICGFIEQIKLKGEIRKQTRRINEVEKELECESNKTAPFNDLSINSIETEKTEKEDVSSSSRIVSS